MPDRLDYLAEVLGKVDGHDLYKEALLLILDELRMLRGQNDKSERMERALVNAFHRGGEW